MEVSAPVEQMRQLYASGFSTRQVAKLTGYSKSYVHKLCRPVIRNRRDALILLGPRLESPENIRTCHAQARRLMEKFLGRKLDRFEYVHHKDEDYTNNNIDNLEVLSPKEHTHKHFPLHGIPRHQRPGRRSYMQSYNRRTLTAVCANCSQSFPQDRYEKSECCSHSCASTLLWKRRRNACNQEA
jgi:hypothetical protein